MRTPLDDRARDEVARAIYENHADRVAADEGEPRYPWGNLTEAERASYRRRVADIEEKVALIHATIVPLGGLPAGEFRFTPSELQLLSRHEHQRWMRERLEGGWNYGPTLDPVARTHPCLVSYDRLSQQEKDKDQEQVERIPLLLRAAGLAVTRRR